MCVLGVAVRNPHDAKALEAPKNNAKVPNSMRT